MPSCRLTGVQVAFLFNHDQVHQVAHGLPIAIALARRRTVGEVTILTGSPRLTAEVQRLLQVAGASLPCVELKLRSRTSRWLAGALDGFIPAAKLTLYRDNLDTFRSLDVLVVAEKTSAILKTRYGMDRLKIVHTRHGAGDRAIGFDAASRRFDHVLVAGEAIRERLVREAGVAVERISIAGYPKFDLLPERRPRLPMQANGRPTVLYNPHVAPHLSSWYRDGRAVLDYFARSDRYNLIFAPHVMLFHRPMSVTIDPPRLHFPGTIPRHIREAANIHIDLSSPACTDMTYTMAADIYLGDVSSQVYEFLLHPRPCVFLNSHDIDHGGDENFAHWQAGDVIDSVSQLDHALADAVHEPAKHLTTQRSLFASHIDLTADASSVRAALAIETFTDRSRSDPASNERDTPLRPLADTAAALALGAGPPPGYQVA